MPRRARRTRLGRCDVAAEDASPGRSWAIRIPAPCQKHGAYTEPQRPTGSASAPSTVSRRDDLGWRAILFRPGYAGSGAHICAGGASPRLPPSCKAGHAFAAASIKRRRAASLAPSSSLKSFALAPPLTFRANKDAESLDGGCSGAYWRRRPPGFVQGAGVPVRRPSSEANPSVWRLQTNRAL